MALSDAVKMQSNCYLRLTICDFKSLLLSASASYLSSYFCTTGLGSSSLLALVVNMETRSLPIEFKLKTDQCIGNPVPFGHFRKIIFGEESLSFDLLFS